jgi:hypothetical protein
LLLLFLRFDELTTVDFGFRDFTVLFSDLGLVRDLFVTPVADLLFIPAFLSEERFVTDLFVTVLVDLRDVLVLTLSLSPEDLSDDLLYWSGCVLANMDSPSLLWSG